MRNVIDLRRPLGSVPIEDIRLDAKSRNDISALLIGLQAIQCLAENLSIRISPSSP